jgi:hypothetical protein
MCDAATATASVLLLEFSPASKIAAAMRSSLRSSGSLGRVASGESLFGRARARATRSRD